MEDALFEANTIIVVLIHVPQFVALKEIGCIDILFFLVTHFIISKAYFTSNQSVTVDFCFLHLYNLFD